MAFELGWDKTLQEIFDGENIELSYPREVRNRYIEIPKSHARVVRADVTHEEHARMPDLHCPVIENSMERWGRR